MHRFDGFSASFEFWSRWWRWFNLKICTAYGPATSERSRQNSGWLQHTAGFLVDETEGTLDVTTASQTAVVWWWCNWCCHAKPCDDAWRFLFRVRFIFGNDCNKTDAWPPARLLLCGTQWMNSSCSLAVHCSSRSLAREGQPRTFNHSFVSIRPENTTTMALPSRLPVSALVEAAPRKSLARAP